MLNYNKSFRESSKSGQKSIYAGNKLHTTSMHIKSCIDVCNDYPTPLKQINYNRKEKQVLRSKEKTKMRATKLNKIQQSFAKRSINLSKGKQQSQYLKMAIQTQRYNQENFTYRKSIDACKKAERLKTDINERQPIGYANQSKGNQLIEIKTEELQNFLTMIQSLKRQKQCLMNELNFYKKINKDSENSIFKILKN